MTTLLLTVGGCGQEPEPEPGRIFLKGQGWPFSIVLPEGWERVDWPALRIEVMGRSPAIDGKKDRRLAVLVGHEPWHYDKSVIELGQYQVDSMRQGATDELTIHKQTSAHFAGEPAERLEYTNKAADRTDRFVTYCVKNLDRGFCVSFAAPEDIFEQHQAELERIVRTFKFEKR